MLMYVCLWREFILNNLLVGLGSDGIIIFFMKLIIFVL